MHSLRPAFTQRGFDPQEWQRQMNRHPQEHIRRKLPTIQLYAQPLELPLICQQLKVCLTSARLYVATYITDGFEPLCQAEKRARQGQLTPQQQEHFKEVLLTTRPHQHHLEGNIWTGQLMKAYLKATCGVTYRGGIYDLLKRLNLSHQIGPPKRAHADYGNADPDKQLLFLNELKQTLLVPDPAHAVLMFDEFSVSQKPSPYYGWAEKNTRPKVVTNEKKESG